MDVNVLFGKRSKKVTLNNDGGTIADVFEAVKSEYNLPDRVLMKSDDICVDEGYHLKDGENIQILIAELVHGANSIPISESSLGKKVGEVIKEYCEVLNVPQDEKLKAEVGGKSVGLSHKIQPGDRIEIVKKKGRKL
jgi:hypothetical protein